MAEASVERWDPIGYQQITGLLTVTGLTIPAGARRCMIQAEASGIRWRDDGTNPTANVGMVLPAAGILEYEGDLESVKLIGQTAGAVANVSYYR